MALHGINATQTLNKYSARAVSDFIQPRGTLDSLYMLFLAVWFGASVLITHNPLFRAITFSFTILFLIFSNLERKYRNRTVYLMGSTLKLFIITFFISFFVGTDIPDLDFSLPFDLSYIMFETFILLTVFLFSIFINSVHSYLLQKYGLSGYQAFVKSIIRGFWVISVGLYFFKAIDILSESLPVYGQYWEEILSYTLPMYLGFSILPASYNSLTNSISKRNPIVNLRDTLLGASFTLLILEFIFHEFSYDFWDEAIPLMLLIGLILLVVRDTSSSYNLQSLYEKSLSKTKEFAEKLNELDYSEPETVFLTSNKINLFKKGDSDLNAGKNTILVPLGISNDVVTIKALGDLSITLRDSLGRLQKDPIEKATFLLPKKEWNKISKQMKSEKLNNIDLTTYNTSFSSLSDFKEELTNSLTVYKNKFNSMGLGRIQENYDLVKSQYGMEMAGDKKEFNFPGIKVIEEPGSHLFKFGSIEVIELEKSSNDNDARYFNIKMPSMSVTEIEHCGRYFVLNMPFTSVLETPKGMVMNLFGFNINEGNREAILADLEHILALQAKLHDYYQLRMSNTLAVEENPSFLLTRKKGELEDNLLLTGSEDSFYINDSKPLALPHATGEVQSDSDVIDIREDDIEVLSDFHSVKSTGDQSIIYSEKMKKLQRRMDRINKTEFIEYMGFKNNKEFLEWLTNLPDESTIRLEEEILYLR